MSFFSKISPTSIEDRLAQLEGLWPAMVKKIQSYDKILDEFNAIRSDLVLMKSGIQSTNTSIQALSDVDSSHKEQLASLQQQYFDKINEFNNKIDELNKSTLNHRSVVSNLFCSLQDQVKTQEGILSSSALKSDMEGVKKKFEGLLQTSQNDWQGLSAFVKGLEKKIENISDSLSSLQSHQGIIASNVTDQSNKVSNLDSKITETGQSCNQAIQSISQQIIETIESKISTFKQELAAAPSEISLLCDEFMKKLESVSLDGSNAVIRSTNASQQIAIVEKKIENIFLLLKKFELSK